MKSAALPQGAADSDPPKLMDSPWKEHSRMEWSPHEPGDSEIADTQLLLTASAVTDGSRGLQSTFSGEAGFVPRRDTGRRAELGLGAPGA